MKFINSGGARAVFKNGLRVLKYPISPAGLIENQTEAERYTKEKDPRLASCTLRTDNILEMEYLEDQTFEYACYQSGVQCEKYDLADRRVQPREIVCDHQCARCPYNKVKDFSEFGDLSEVCGADKRVQCGFSVDGTLKVYDYGSDSQEELKLRSGTVPFYPGLAPVLLQWVEGGNKPEEFSAWAKEHEEELPERIPQLDFRWQNKYFRKKVCDGTITWKD